MATRILNTLLLVSAVSLMSCSGTRAPIPTAPLTWNPNGSFTIAKPLPPVKVESGPVQMEGFLPLKPALGMETGWGPVTVDRDAGEMKFTTPVGRAVSVKVHIAGDLPTGSFKIIHKQKNPAWHASDAYFLNRHLPIPPEGDRNRLLKGALGKAALFTDAGFPVHCGEIWSEDVGGIQADCSTIEALYSGFAENPVIIVK